MRKSDLESKIAIAKAELAELKETRSAVLTAQSWRTQDGNSSREVRNVNLATLDRMIREKEKEITSLEAALNNFSGYTLRVGVKW